MKSILFFVTTLAVASLQAKEINLVQNPDFESVSGKSPDHYELKGAAFWGFLGKPGEFTTNGILFPGDAPQGGAVSQLVTGLDQRKGRWITFRFRGLAEDGFSVPGDTLKMKIEFFSRNGANYLDCASRTLYEEIVRDRKDLTANGDFHRQGAAVWRSYDLEELIPFPEVDAVRLSISYDTGVATTSAHAAFLIDDFSLVQRDVSFTGKVDPAITHPPALAPTVDVSKLTSLGGRWFYLPLPRESMPTPLIVTSENADRLFYKSDRLVNPFLNNMSAWLRAGYLDEKGNVVAKDKFVPDNVVLTFKGDGFLTIQSKNLPNHPTARFPGFNPNPIIETESTYRLPLEPTLNPDAVSIDQDRKRALPMGPIGIAVNGVVFFNPFDAGMQDASNIMDYCCGHPNPDGVYHYHKYPICVNTPFADKGDGPSPVIGFAFDGLPIYGPYQTAGVMAKDSTTNPLNAFNACYDAVRGWHYHVTPGKFPYLIGGYFAKVEASDVGGQPRHRLGGMFPPGPPPDEFPGGPQKGRPDGPPEPPF